MVRKIVTLLLGHLSDEDKKVILELLKALIKSGAEGAVSGAMKSRKD